MNYSKNFLVLILLTFLLAISGCSSTASTDSARSDQAGNPGSTEAVESGKAMGTKLTHHWDYSITIKDTREAISEIQGKAKELGGYLVESEVSQASDNDYYGHLVVKIPQDKIQDMSEFLHSLGTVKRASTRSEDISEEYYDIEARLEVMKKQEERLLSFMDNKTASVEDLLAVEREITQVREKRESLQARMNYLNNAVQYTQFNINLDQSDNQIAAPQGTLGKAHSALIKSLNFMFQLFDWAVIAVIVLIPYLALAGLIYIIYRAVKKRRRSKTE